MQAVWRYRLGTVPMAESACFNGRKWLTTVYVRYSIALQATRFWVCRSGNLRGMARGAVLCMMAALALRIVSGFPDIETDELLILCHVLGGFGEYGVL